MSEVGLLFITAPVADHKAINRLLLHLRDWRFGDEGAWDGFHAVLKKDLELLNSSMASGDVEPTTPPCAEGVSNEWQNSTLGEVESFVLTLSKQVGANKGHRANTSIYLLLDAKGLEDKTCIVGEQKTDDETDQPTNTFNKVRVPWEECQIMWANLDISNMDFDEYCDDEDGEGEDSWYTWNDSGALGLEEDQLAMREDAIKKLEDEGMA